MRLVLAILLLGLGVSAEAPDAPKLTEVQRLRLQTLVLARDNAQLRLDAFARDLSVPGYDISTTTWDYVKHEPDATK